MSDAAEAITKADKRKRFLEDLKNARGGTAMRMIAEMVFDIQDFQETQNHNSTAANNRLNALDKKFAAILVLLLLHLLLTAAPEFAFVVERLVPILRVFFGQ